MKNILLIAVMIFLSITTFSQGGVTVTATDSTVFCGECTEISAVGTYPNDSQIYDFEGGWPLGWAIPQCGMLFTQCNNGNFTQCAWMGSATAAPRTLTTNSYNTICGGEICFDFYMATPGGTAPCEDPDLPNEGMYLEYSINGGLTWVTMDYFDPTVNGAFSYGAWQTYCYQIPPQAQTPFTMFRWHQQDSSGPCCDHWGVDNVNINLTNCNYYYDWEHISGYPDNPTVSVCPTTDTTYTVWWTDGVDSYSDDIEISIEVFDINLSLPNPEPIDSCGGCTQIDATIVNPASSPYNWTWNGPNLTNITDSSVMVCPLNDAWYEVTAEIGGCVSTDSIYIDVDISVPDGSVFISPNLCSPAIMEISNDVGGSNCHYIVIGPDDIHMYHGCDTFIDEYEYAGTYNIEFNVISSDGCYMDTTIINAFEVYQTPVASFNWTPNEGSIIENIIQFNNTTFGGEDYVWDLGDGDTSTDINVTHKYLSVGSYDVVLSVSTQWGCSDTAYGRVHIKDDFYVYVPNTFTPDGDQFNNEFKPVISRHDIWDYHMVIYNRWGEVMFESYNSDFGWDGTYGGSLVDSGVYVWTITTKVEGTSELKEFRGHVTVLR